ncbi:MAG: hypothetical protein ABIO82_06105 [Ginsengibacter sp.]
MFKLGTLFILIMLCHTGKSQVHGGLEQYYYSSPGSSVVVPKLYYQTTDNWLGEIRYNYEQLETISFLAGKMFTNNKALSYSITPLAGVIWGKMKGGLIGSDMTLNYKHLFFSSEPQYTFSVEEKTENFFFSWSELGYDFTKMLYAGFALQSTHLYRSQSSWEPGIMMGLNYKNWTFPVYIFSPADENRNLVLGVNWEWEKSKQGN